MPRASPDVAVIAAVPSATAVTSPDPSTRATPASLDDQVNSASTTKCPFASNAFASSRSVSLGAIVSAVGDTTTEPAECITDTTASPDASPDVAAIVVSPTPAAVTNPAESTAATLVSALDQATGTPSIARPAWSRTSAPSCAVCPSAVSATVSGVTAMVVGAAATTVRSARPVTPAAVAVSSACPGPSPLTRPASSTTATSVSLDAHLNSAPDTAWPFASVATAAKRNVSPATSVSAAGVTVTALTLWATDTVALPETAPAVAVIVAVPLPAAVTRPDPSTIATGALSLAQATVAPAITCPFWFAHLGAELNGRAQRGQFGRGRAHRHGRGPRGIGGRGRGLRRPVAAGVCPQGRRQRRYR